MAALRQGPVLIPRIFPSRIVVAPLCMTCVAGCMEQSGRANQLTMKDTLVSGIIIVENGSLESRADPPLSPPMAWEIGGDDDGSTVLGEPIGIGVDSWRRTFVLDRRLQNIRVFDALGAFVRFIGGRGAGPGEFEAAEGVALSPQGTLWVVDHAKPAYQVFDTTGVFLASHRRDVSGYDYGWPGGFLQDSSLWDVTRIPGPSGHLTALVRFESNQGFTDTLSLLFANDAPQPVYEVMLSNGKRILATVPFTARRTWTLDPRGFVWAAVTSEYAIAKLSLDGDTIVVIRAERRRVPVTAAERDAALAPLRRRGGPNAADSRRIPALKPVFERLITDDRGFLWVLLHTTAADPRTRFDIFRSDGGFVTTVALPARLNVSGPIVIKDERLYGVAFTERGSPRIKVFELAVVYRARR
jgi:hypothetical protein